MTLVGARKRPAGAGPSQTDWPWPAGVVSTLILPATASNGNRWTRKRVPTRKEAVP